MRQFPVMLFAAGFGTRMGALTQTRPKPLIEVAGKALLDHALDVVQGVGHGPIVVNLHYKGEQIAAHLAGRDIALSWEREVILETGGGLRAALPLLGDGPVMTLNTDAIWTGQNALRQLAEGWREGEMDALLLLGEVPDARDFNLDASGRLVRAAGQPGLQYLGAQIIRTEGLVDFDEAAFSLNRLWDRQIAAGRAFGIVHQGGWCDVGHPEGIAIAEAMLAQSRDG